VLDSSGKVPDGIMAGMVVLPGNFYECLDIEVESEHFRYLAQRFWRYKTMVLQ